MRPHVQGIDHVVVLVRDLERARDAYARMGFTPTPRGFHTLGSQNHCLMFGRDYVELLAVPKPHPAMQHYTEFLARGEGLGAIALATDDAAGLQAGLAAEGIAADAPLEFSRPVEGLGEARFRIVQLPADATPGCRVFACQHFTRERVWRPEYQAHANGAQEIAAMAVIAEDPAGAAASYAPVAFASRWKLGHRLQGAGLPLRPRPLVAALFVRVADRARAAALLRRNGIALAALADGSFAVSAQDAHGVAVVFG
jgi:catechol 2,3-dioxygenase-like lactoylglutathione lyase family enzyme